VQLAYGKQTLGERVGAAHDLQWASGGSSINASRTLRDDVFQRDFSNLLGRYKPTLCSRAASCY
ncbi:hypothetical protein AB3X96_41910, partial [Paraburkholderia sp. BR13439]|uniref:hypothetical protein n=1 Tax=Paraburkholderia sp. BR13439 TaxID=3236996 RepID=UPI0034CDF1EE